MAWRIIACLVMGYLFGNLNGAILVSRIFEHEDVRKKGSGNAGLTNFLRNYGGWQTALVVVIDLGKMVAACLLATLIYPEDTDLAKMMTGAAVQIGHIFPVFFGFHGGKGILCSAALALLMDWRIFVIAVPVFLVIFFATRIVSLGSILATMTYGALFVIFFTEKPWVWGIALFMCALVIFMHRQNIVRLIHGEEKKIVFHKSKKEEQKS